MTDRPALRDALVRDEGIRFKTYRCTAGKLTIGVGRNLDDVGISRDEAMLLLDNDIARVEADARKHHWFGGLDAARQEVVLNMIFNLGATSFAKFYQTIAAIAAADYAGAADRMRKSLWARQVGARAERLAKQMETGERQ
jgi:lysozyme